MIFRMLDNLRAKPEPVRRQVAAIATVAITGVILFVWARGLPERLSRADGGEDSALSPFSVLKEQGKVLYDSAGDGISAAKNILSGETLPAGAAIPELEGDFGSTTPEVPQEASETPSTLAPADALDSYIPVVPE